MRGSSFGSRGVRRAGFAGGLAVLLAGVVLSAGAALGRTSAAVVVHSASVSGPSSTATHESIVVTARGRAVYELSGDSAHHPKCTSANGCWSAWPPVTVSSGTPSAGSGVHGSLGVWRRGNIRQLTLAGHPLYTFSGDSASDAATGEGLHSFGGTWGVVAAGSHAASKGTGGTSGW